MTGRYVEIAVYPLSFEELVIIKEAESRKEIDELFTEYMTFGGFPSIPEITSENLKTDFLKGVFNSIIVKDIMVRSGLGNADLLQKITIFLLDNIGNQVSSNKIAATLTSNGTKVSNETINKYLILLEDAFVFYRASRYDLRGKQRLKTQDKFYVVDNGMRNAVLGRNDTNRGSQIENLVYLKLLQSGYEVFVGKYDTKEIDFVCFKNDIVKHIQVTLSVPKNSKRETDNLLLVKENVERLLVTGDYADVGYIDGIEVVHIADFLLSDL